MTAEGSDRGFDRLGLLAFLFGTGALVSTAVFYPLAILLGIGATWCGLTSLHRRRAHRLKGGRVLAYWGLITGVVGFVIAFGLTVVSALITEDPRIRDAIRRELEQQQDAEDGGEGPRFALSARPRP